jgi:hypothetical protein
VSVDVPIKDIPQAVLDDAGLRLQDYLVPLSGISGTTSSEPRCRFIGSGTLVEIGGVHHILTAAHVWHEARDDQHIAFALTAYPSAFAMPRDAIIAKTIWDRTDPDWGPDLALLQIPEPFVSRIQAHKSFLNLPQQKAALPAHPPTIAGRLWAVTGMVGEFSDIQVRFDKATIDANVHGRAFFSGMLRTHQRDDYDYLDTAAKLDLVGVPSSFGGVSGGGLWEVGLSVKNGKLAWNGRRHFRGVAFWQSSVVHGRRIIRCHGPRSIFETAWGLWALPRVG